MTETAPLVVAHVIPVYRAIEAEVVAGALSLAFRWGGRTPEHWYLKANTQHGSPVMHNRNLLTKWALEENEPPDGLVSADCRGAPGRAGESGPPADIILWQDADVPASVDELVALVRALERAPPDVGAVAAGCVMNDPGPEPPVNINFVDHPEGKALFDEGRVVECSLAGFGLIATRASVFRALEFPWFEWGYRGGIEHVVGEDMGWCEKARLAGFSIFAHGALLPEHVFPRAYRRTTSRNWLAASAPREGGG
jgi:hypothetical protein